MEFKFRGICVKSKEFVYGDLVHGVGLKERRRYMLPRKANLAYIKHYDPIYGVEVIPETVGISILKNDVFGNEIYVGDVINVFCRATSRNRGDYTVIYKDFRFILTSANKKGDEYGPFTYNLDDLNATYTIKGNIHQNPELIKLDNKK